jgi:hypothetical protein
MNWPILLGPVKRDLIHLRNDVESERGDAGVEGGLKIGHKTQGRSKASSAVEVRLRRVDADDHTTALRQRRGDDAHAAPDKSRKGPARRLLHRPMKCSYSSASAARNAGMEAAMLGLVCMDRQHRSYHPASKPCGTFDGSIKVCRPFDHHRIAIFVSNIACLVGRALRASKFLAKYGKCVYDNHRW